MKRKVDKLYALNNSYFKNKKDDYPDSMPEIVKYKCLHGELPFSCPDAGWLYAAMTERQKRRGVQNSQHLTPEKTAGQIADLTDNFAPKDNIVLDACCGTGQLTKRLLSKGLKVVGFDNDPDMVEICGLVYPQAKFDLYDFRDKESASRFDLVVSNPPHEQKDLALFFRWLSSALTDEGKAILLIPKGFMGKQRPKMLAEYLSRFERLHSQDMAEEFAHTKAACEICIAGLSESYKKARRARQKTEPQAQIIINEPLKTNLMETEKVVLVSLDEISPNPDNSRKKFNHDELAELAHSIREHGLLHAIVLRVKAGKYEIVYGERRYRAFRMNGQTHIPAIIREYTDEQLLEITLVENINRRDLSVIEESDAYQKLLDIHKYKIEDICHKLGKNESYIRNRLRLQNLIDNFRDLLEKGEIPIGTGLETARFSKQIQKQIYKEHFTGEASNWKDLGVKEYAERIAKLYANDLSEFNFDKSECSDCQFNTALYNLFPGKSGQCTNSDCLLKKKNTFTTNFCKVASEQFPEISVCIAPFDKMNGEVEQNLKEIGLDIKTMKVEEYPCQPLKPSRPDYSTEEAYNAAMDEYNIEEMAFYKEIEEIDDKIHAGEFKKVIYIGDNNPVIGYVKLMKKDESDPLEVLEKQDKANKEAASKNAAKDVAAWLRESRLPTGELSLFEDELLLFVMLDYLDKKYFPAVGFTDAEKQKLADQEKYKIIKSASVEQRALIRRNFLKNNLNTQFGANIRSMLLIEFSKQHFEEETKDIIRKHTDSYEKKREKIQSRIRTLKQKEETADVF